MKEFVILVNEKDKKIGIGEKLEVHKKGKLHRAFSIFLFDKKKRLLLQKRAKTKYHSGGLWSNTCCSHPRPGEKIEKAAQRRLKEEMGIGANLKKIMKVHYRLKVGDLIENEIDHIFIGFFEGKPRPNKNEVEGWQWKKINEIIKDQKKNPKKYTSWFKILFPKVIKKINVAQ